MDEDDTLAVFGAMPGEDHPILERLRRIAAAMR